MYAANTQVPVDRSQQEVRKILTKYGATGFAFAEANNSAMVIFEILDRRIRFNIPIPSSPKNASQKQKDRDAQSHRAKWRSLVLCIKAKLECVASGITTLEQEFMAHIVLPNGRTVGDLLLPQINESYQTGNMPPLLGPGSGSDVGFMGGQPL